ncbi:hypothetical protein E2C01_050158 [Portunus trituberculatus]|uniref:Uncharacterized protein n=1 Tax=Portunus trituberculatus TaxID=210409 RepID=A0A5B7GI57_PORTR|nr:hypothetical protein [Portunus trituberculatus]
MVLIVPQEVKSLVYPSCYGLCWAKMDVQAQAQAQKMDAQLREFPVVVQGHLSEKQRASYPCVVEGLECKFGQQYQVEGSEGTSHEKKPSAAKPIGVNRTSTGEFRGSSWGCGKRGHKRSRWLRR